MWTLGHTNRTLEPGQAPGNLTIRGHIRWPGVPDTCGMVCPNDRHVAGTEAGTGTEKQMRFCRRGRKCPTTLSRIEDERFRLFTDFSRYFLISSLISLKKKIKVVKPVKMVIFEKYRKPEISRASTSWRFWLSRCPRPLKSGPRGYIGWAAGREHGPGGEGPRTCSDARVLDARRGLGNT
jgi:hypothetical protein